MIIEGLLELLYSLLEFVFSAVSLPTLPDSVMDVIEQFKSYIIGGIDIIGLVIDWDFLKIMLPIVVVLINFDKIWRFIVFIVKKIPFIDIE